MSKLGLKPGDVINKHLEELLKTCTPYVRTEASVVCRFDVIAYIPNGKLFPINKSQALMTHCYHKFRRNHCLSKWEEIRAQAKMEFRDYKRYFLYEDKEYEEDTALWMHVKDRCLCDPSNCKTLEEDIKRWTENRKKYGFMEGLHIFETKSNKDDFSRLDYQIPRMLWVADYVWLVLGQYQPIPMWLPPYIGVIRHYNKDNTFEIERMSGINPHELQYPNCNNSVLDDHYCNIRGLKSKPTALFRNLLRKWQINSLFRWMFEGQIVCDMTEELRQLQSLANEVKEKTPEVFQKEVAKTLMEFDEQRI
jgi:hypothetical protein